jgi:hypothetical protein
MASASQLSYSSGVICHRSLVFVLSFVAPVLLVHVSSAAVRELWRVGLTNEDPLVVYSASAAAVDTNGNTYVAGYAVKFSDQTLFVACFDAAGVKQWEFNDEPRFVSSFDSMTLTPSGDVVIAQRLSRETSSITMISAGVQQWTRTEPHAFANSQPTTALVSDSLGQIFGVAFEPTEQPPGQQTPCSLFKLDADGHEIWRTRLPFVPPLLGGFGVARTLAVTPKGDPVVAGVSGGIGLINGVSGKTRWTRSQQVARGFASVAAGPKSICIAGDNGYAVFANGKRLATRRGPKFSADRVSVTRNGGFLLLTPITGYSATLLTSSGRIRWQKQMDLFFATALIEEDEDQFVAIGRQSSHPDSLAFAHLNAADEQISTDLFAGYNNVFWDQFNTVVYAAPDGTLRVVVNRMGFLGATITAFGTDP